jgi:hypothetical protein
VLIQPQTRTISLTEPTESTGKKTSLGITMAIRSTEANKRAQCPRRSAPPLSQGFAFGLRRCLRFQAPRAGFHRRVYPPLDGTRSTQRIERIGHPGGISCQGHSTGLAGLTDSLKMEAGCNQCGNKAGFFPPCLKEEGRSQVVIIPRVGFS